MNPPAAPSSGPDPHALTEAQIKEAEVPTALYRLATIYKQSGDMQRLIWSLQRLNELVPNNGDLKLALASVYAEQGDSAKAYETLLHMQEQGFGYDIANNPAFAKIPGTKIWDYLVANLQGEPASRSAKARSRSRCRRAITCSSRSRTIPSASSFSSAACARARSIASARTASSRISSRPAPTTASGASTRWPSMRRTTRSTSPAPRRSTSRASIRKTSARPASSSSRLSTGKLLQQVPARAGQPAAHACRRIAIGKDGQVFAADGLRNIIYRLDGGTLKVMVENPKLTSIRGLAVSDDGKRLYFADYSLGVFGVDLGAGKGFRSRLSAGQARARRHRRHVLVRRCAGRHRERHVAQARDAPAPGQGWPRGRARDAAGRGQSRVRAADLRRDRRRFAVFHRQQPEECVRRVRRAQGRDPSSRTRTCSRATCVSRGIGRRHAT